MRPSRFSLSVSPLRRSYADMLGPCFSLALLASLSAAACSDDSGAGPRGSGYMLEEADDETMGGSGGGSITGNGAGNDTGGTMDPGDDPGEGSGSAGDDTDPDDGAGGGMAFSERGVCGARATGVVTAEDFQIKEERYLLSDGGFGPDICVVSFDVTRIGDAPPGCDENAGQQEECLWTHRVRYDNPSVVLDENGVCANSELGMDADAIAAIDGFEVAYGYVFEFQGHNSVLMLFNEQTGSWEPGANAGWDEMTGNFLFDDRRGACRYAPGEPAP